MQEKTGIHPKAPVSRAEETAVSTETNSTLFTGGMLAQLHTVFARMAAPLVLRLYLDETPLSAELKQYMEELAAQSSKLTAEIGTAEEMEHLPCVRVCRRMGAGQASLSMGSPAATSSPPSSWASTMPPGRGRLWTKIQEQRFSRSRSLSN